MKLKNNQILLYVLPPDNEISFRTYGHNDYAYFVAILPRGYHLEHDEKGEPYISCPGGARVYDFHYTRRNAERPAFDYDFHGKRRRVYLEVDYETTYALIREALEDDTERIRIQYKDHERNRGNV